MKIAGLTKFSLLDYPKHTAAVIFTCGCNMRCPFCHNPSLVLPEKYPKLKDLISEEEVFTFLDKRKKILEGVCITGGEPTMQSGLYDFIFKIKEKGFKVKLDTNGLNPAVLEKLYNDNLLDYVAMDIKNSFECYGETCGLVNFDVTPVKKSIELITASNVGYEFRTTVIKEYHDEKSIKSICSVIKGAERFVLQKYKENENVCLGDLHAFSDTEMRGLLEICAEFVETVELR